MTTIPGNTGQAVDYVKTQLGITGTSQDSQIEAIVKASVQKIFGMTKIDLLNENAEEVELHDGAGQKHIFVHKAPIESVVSVEYNTGSQTTTIRNEYDIDRFNRNDNTVTINSGYHRGYKNIRITTKMLFTEFDEIPSKYDDLKYALVLIVGNLMKIKEMSGLKSESVSGTSLVFDKSVINEEVTQMISKYRFYAI